VLVLEPALDEVIGDLWETSFGQLAQAVEIDGSVQARRHVSIPPDGKR
jgi:hypothetical protein